MSEIYPATVPQAILMFHFADRLKAELLLASRLLSEVIHMEGAQQEGGRRLFSKYLMGLDQEITLAHFQISAPDMIRVKTVCTGLIGMAEVGLLKDIQQHLTWMITIMTTYAQRAMEFLQKEKLL